MMIVVVVAEHGGELKIDCHRNPLTEGKEAICFDGVGQFGESSLLVLSRKSSSCSTMIGI